MGPTLQQGSRPPGPQYPPLPCPSASTGQGGAGQGGQLSGAWARRCNTDRQGCDLRQVTCPSHASVSSSVLRGSHCVYWVALLCKLRELVPAALTEAAKPFVTRVVSGFAWRRGAAWGEPLCGGSSPGQEVKLEPQCEGQAAGLMGAKVPPSRSSAHVRSQLSGREAVRKARRMWWRVCCPRCAPRPATGSLCGVPVYPDQRYRVPGQQGAVEDMWHKQPSDLDSGTQLLWAWGS